MNTVAQRLTTKISRAEATEIAKEAQKNPNILAELLECYYSKKIMLSQRASWSISKLAIIAPEIFTPYLIEMATSLDHKTNDTITRNTIRIFQEVDIPEEIIGLLYSKCADYLLDPKKAIAIRAFSMTVLYKIATKEKGLLSEVALMIEEAMPHGSSGIKARGRTLLKKISKEL